MIQTTGVMAPSTLSVAIVDQNAEEAASLHESLAGLTRWEVDASHFVDPNALAARLAAGGVDLVVLDLDFGEAEGGFDVLQYLRACVQYDGAILMLTKRRCPELARYFLRDGADGSLHEEDLDPWLLESMVRVALTLPHRGR